MDSSGREYEHITPVDEARVVTVDDVINVVLSDNLVQIPVHKWPTCHRNIMYVRRHSAL